MQRSLCHSDGRGRNLPLTHQQVLVNSPLLSYVQMEMEKKKAAVTLTRLSPYVHHDA